MKYITKTSLRIFTTAAVLTTLMAGVVWAAEPLAGLKMVREFEISGRKVLRYEHGEKGNNGKKYFFVLPCENVKNPPLRVILHHAGGSGQQALNEAYKSKHRHQYGSKDYAILYLDCRNDKPDWWWGWHGIKKNKDKYANKLYPTEKRVLDTVEWVIKNQKADRNRVYLSGRSMGGTGSLGIGYCRGDIFAAILVNVPAGADHVLFRLKNSNYPDPPPTINTSSQTDGWSKGQEDLLAHCKKNKLPMIFAWGPFGHASRPDMANRAVYDFPWLKIVKNEAYPVFTDSDSDETYPGHKNKTGKDQKGQINGYYRWKNITDTDKNFAIQLRLVKNDELGKPETIPQESTADVTLRRLQAFKVKTGESHTWKTVRNGKVLQEGEVRPDKNGLLTVRRVKIDAVPVQLQVAVKKQGYVKRNYSDRSASESRQATTLALQH
ncbi:MAG: hypothetical protein ISS69_06580 [Phycisphaerae bacterium]|nr:hypothetical protein [Planctomycetota bacterium]MBL7219758.1 hypothetical protein [Phycisphaerae bacterium]